jgi:RNA polymerase sigma-70 factor (ECF subfamily)
MADDFDDRRLVRRMLAQDEAAFDRFFEAFFPRLFRFALRRVDNADVAEEIVQSTLVIAVRKLQTWRGEAALFTWLCTICRRELSAYWRRTSRTPELRPLDDDPDIQRQLEALAADVDSPDRVVERRELAERVQIALDYLPGRYGDVLEWKYIHGLTVADIATKLDSTPKAVESMLSRARDAFRDAFATLQEIES